jgi:hypothetical protein
MSETSSGAAEEIVWRGTSSQWKNFGVYVLCGLFCWLLVPIFFALARFLQTKCKIFELTTQRFKITSGVFTKTNRDAGIISGEGYRNAATVFLTTGRHREHPDDYIRRIIANCVGRRRAVERWIRGQITQSGRDHSPGKTVA